MEIGKMFDQGRVIGMKRDELIEAMEWNAHPVFKGVHLKHIVKGEETDGRFSVHLVRVQPGCALGEHLHKDQWELHEILQGQGVAKLAGKEMLYKPGVMSVIPLNERHEVHAEEELVVMAAFVPALL